MGSVWASEDNLKESVISLHHVSSRDQTQARGQPPFLAKNLASFTIPHLCTQTVKRKQPGKYTGTFSCLPM